MNTEVKPIEHLGKGYILVEDRNGKRYVMDILTDMWVTYEEWLDYGIDEMPKARNRYFGMA